MKFIVCSSKSPEVVLAIVKPGMIITLVFLLLGICAVGGFYAFKIASVVPSPVSASAVGGEPVRQLGQHLSDYRKRLTEQKEVLEETKRFTSEHLNAMGVRLGLLQAQVMRLNALGERLTSLSGLNEGEFNFDGVPGQGGAREPLDNLQYDLDNTDLVQMFDNLDGQVARNEQELSVLEALIMDRELDSALHPDGWPMLGGWISSKFGLRRDPFSGSREFHKGLDIANKPGAEIKAAAAGVVSFAGNKPIHGFTVEINHGSNYVTRYGHASELLVSTGERVEKGQSIAIIGSTGRSTGLHLHFEIYKDNKRVNPLQYLSTAKQ